MRTACIEHLAQLTNTSLVAIKLKYGKKLDRSTVPFISDKKIDKIFAKLRVNYEKKKRKFMEAKLLDREVNFPWNSVILFQFIVYPFGFLLIKWDFICSIDQ